MPPRQPESVAALARADQVNAARTDATRAVMTLLAAGARMMPADRPWADSMLASVTPSAYPRACPTVGHPLAGPQPLYVLWPGYLMCRICFEGARTSGAADPTVCAVCHRPDDWLRAMVACRDLTIAYGQFCLNCGYA